VGCAVGGGAVGGGAVGWCGGVFVGGCGRGVGGVVVLYFSNRERDLLICCVGKVVWDGKDGIINTV
jgi:hypothetical protein